MATLWPFNPFPRNRVSWLQGSNGLKFEKAALVVSNEPLTLPETSRPESYTLELLLRPASIKSSQTILAFYSPIRARQLLVRQWTDGLLVTHDASVEHDMTGTVKFYVDRVFHLATLVFVAVSSGRNGTTVYVDGQRAQSFPRFEIARTDLFGEMVLGTSPVTYQPWSGEIQGLAVYAKELTPQEASQHYRSWTDLNGHPPASLEAAIARFTFAEASGTEIYNEVASRPHLRIPATFSVPHKPFLESPAQEFKTSRHYAHEMATNIAGFVPLGLVVCSYLAWTRTRWKAILITISFCAMLSFTIEVLQYCIPTRGSGITDIITNTFGATLGAVLMESSSVRKLLQRTNRIPPVQNVAQQGD
ncbi:MAG: VanZ family protein [Acidobacteriia bacterium]|nr:VanZ family protein [Terriglobia bacterium]